MFANKNLPRVPGQGLIDQADSKFDELVGAYLKDPVTRYTGLDYLPATPMPSVLHMVGLPNQWVAYSGSVIHKAFGTDPSKKRHAEDFDGLNKDEVNRVMRAPMFVMRTDDGEYELVSDYLKDGKLIIFALKPGIEETEGLRPGQKLNMTLVKSAYAMPWKDYEFDGRMRQGLEKRIAKSDGRKVIYADHIKLADKIKDLSAPPSLGLAQRALPASPAKERVEKGLQDKVVLGYGDLVNFINKHHKGPPEDKPMFSPAGRNAAGQNQKPELPAETKFRAFRRVAQDKLNRFTVINEWLVENGVTLSEQADVHKYEERMHSRFATVAAT